MPAEATTVADTVRLADQRMYTDKQSSRASAGEMLKRLEAEGLIERGEHKEALLTPSGRARAEKVVRKHRLIERMLTDFMGYTAAEAHVHADDLGDGPCTVLTHAVLDRLCVLARQRPLGRVERAALRAEHEEAAAAEAGRDRGEAGVERGGRRHREPVFREVCLRGIQFCSAVNAGPDHTRATAGRARAGCPAR